MSNYIVTRGLGGGLIVTGGWGAELMSGSGGEIISLTNGNLKIFIRRSGDEVILFYWDSGNMIETKLPVTADQLAGNDWMIVKITRSGNNLLISLDKNDPVTVSLSSIETYGGTVTLMNGGLTNGALFDLRMLPKAITKEAVEYYIDDIKDNSGKTLLPNR